jgi:tyrosine-protein kinase Etk/Wzc
LVTGGTAFLLPRMYTASASIMPPQQQQSTAAALLGQLGPIAGAAGNNLGIKNPGDIYVAILGSRSIADDLVQAYDLQKLYDVRTVSEARKVLANRSSFSTGKDPLVRISVEDREPKRAAALANAFVDELYKQNGRLALTESGQRRLFFERQLEAQKKALADSEAAMNTTQERTGVVQVNSQVEAVIRSITQLRAEIAAREVALASLKSGATAQNPEVVRQETELTAMREQMRKLESRGEGGQPGDTAIPTSRVPQVGLEYMRSLRELKYNETLLELLAKEYETARIDEAKDAPVIQVVDFAVPPELKSWPPRAIFTLAGALFCGVAACLIVVASSHLRDSREAHKFHMLKSRLVG